MLKNTSFIVMCIGYKNFFLDSVGPIVGSLIKNKYNTKVYVYGCLNSDINAGNIKKYYNFIKNKHKNSKIIIIDSAISKNSKEGTITVKSIKGNVAILATTIGMQNFDKHSLEKNKIKNIMFLSKTISKTIKNMY